MYLEAKSSQLEEFAQLVGERTQVVVVQHQFAQTVKYLYRFYSPPKEQNCTLTFLTTQKININQKVALVKTIL